MAFIASRKHATGEFQQVHGVKRLIRPSRERHFRRCPPIDHDLSRTQFCGLCDHCHLTNFKPGRARHRMHMGYLERYGKPHFMGDIGRHRFAQQFITDIELTPVSSSYKLSKSYFSIRIIAIARFQIDTKSRRHPERH